MQNRLRHKRFSKRQQAPSAERLQTAPSCHPSTMFLRMLTMSLCLLLNVNDMNGQRVAFSRQHGFFERPFALSLTVEGTDHPEDFAIVYTTDGSEPTMESKIWTHSLVVNDNMVIRAAAADGDGVIHEISTATFLFADKVMQQPALPQGYPEIWGNYCQISGVATADYEMDPDMTQDPALSKKIKDGLTAIPTLSIVTAPGNFFNHENSEENGGIYIFTGTPVGDGTGRGWERPVSMELFGGKEKLDLTANCGVRIHGGHSRLAEKTPKHSLRLVFKKTYGAGKLKYPLFGEDGPDKFDKLVLRAHFGNSWTHWDNANRVIAQYERDMWARAIQERMGHPASRGMYVHLYINGLYWGLYNLAERIDEDYCVTNFGGQEADYDVIKVEEDHTGHQVVADNGSMKKWTELLKLAEKASSSNEAYFQLTGCDADGQPDPDVETLLDVGNFIDYMLINQYGGNTDWDHHNWVALRDRVRTDKGFRFICWDSECILTSLNTNNLSLDNSYCPSHVFTQLMRNPVFLHRFQNRAYQLLEDEGGWLTPEKVVQVWDSLYHVIELPLYDEAARWGDYRRDVHPYQGRTALYTVDNQYMTERDHLLESYFPRRSNVLIGQLKEKGWYSAIPAPEIRLNGSTDILTPTITFGDMMNFKASYIVYYTLDGTDPVTWVRSSNGNITPSASRYSAGVNILDKVSWSQTDTLTVKAVCKNGSEWSPVIERRFAIDQATDITLPAIAGNERQQGIYDLSGRKIDNDADLKSGIYIINGKKVMVR